MKVHLKRENTTLNDLLLCNSSKIMVNKKTLLFEDFMLIDEEKRCKKCENSRYFAEQLSKAESKRPLEKDEFEEPKRLKVTFNNGFITVKNMIDNQHNDLFNFSKREERISITKDYIHLGRFFSDDEPRAKEILDFISNGFVDVSKVETVKVEHKTQESLNKAIEKEDEKQPLDEPYIDFAEGMKEHYEKTQEYKKWLTSENEQKDTMCPSKYHVKYYSMIEKKSIVLDVYDLLEPLMLPNAEIEHTFKKLVRCGKGDKSLLQDLEEAKTQLEMGIERIKKENGEND